MPILSFPELSTPAGLRAQVMDLRRQAWPGGPDKAHDPALDPVSMLLVDDGTVVAALDILAKEIVHAGTRYSAAGLSTVVTRADRRGQGHGLRLVAAAHAAMAEREFDLGLFTCDSPLETFYARAGWRALPGTVLVGGTPLAPFPSDRPDFDKVTMADFFSALGKRNEGSFRHARVELYPGEIDKLW